MNNNKSIGISKSNRRWKVASITAAVTATLVAAGCGSSGSSSGNSGGNSSTKGWTFAYVTNLTTSPSYITMNDGAVAYAKKLGIKVTYQGPSAAGESQPSVQVGILNAVLATKPKALIISPSNATALIAPIERFKDAGIPVIAVDTTISDSSPLVTQITSNNQQGGALAAETIAKDHNYQGDVAIESVPPGTTTADARVAGFEAQLKKYPKMKLIAVENDQATATVAEAQAKSLILAHPGIVGIFSTTDDGGDGAGAAVVAEGKKGKITVVAYDAEPAEVQLLRSGVISVLIVQKPAVEGADAVKYAYDYLTGKKSEIPKKVVLTNLVATTQNMNSLSISKWFYTQTLTK